MEAKSFLPMVCAPTAVDADGVCASQTPAAGVILINGLLATGGVATFGAAQLVRLTSGGNDLGITFTFNGTDSDNRVQSETVAGTNASNTDTTKFFKTITSITKSGASAGTIIVGNLITSVSNTISTNLAISPFSLGIGVQLVSGTGTYKVQHTYEDASASHPATWFDSATGEVTASSQATYAAPVAAVRLRMTVSGPGVLSARVLQAG